MSADELSDLIDARMRAVIPTLIVRPEEKPADRWLSVTETMAILHVTRPTLWQWERDGKLVPHRIGRRPLYLESEIEKAMQ